jgi:hypothetical protein
MTIPNENLGAVTIGGATVKIVSLLGPNDDASSAPAVIHGNVRERMVLADPATGAPIDLLKGLKSTTLSGPYTLSVDDNFRDFICTVPLTVTVPAGLVPTPTCTFDCPPTGNLSFASSGGTTINGTASTLTRTRDDNPAGVALRGHHDADTYGLSGS